MLYDITAGGVPAGGITHCLITVSARVVELDKLVQGVNPSTGKINDLRSTVGSLRCCFTQQSEKLGDLEGRSRCSNLVIYSVSAVPDETCVQL